MFRPTIEDAFIDAHMDVTVSMRDEASGALGVDNHVRQGFLGIPWQLQGQTGTNAPAARVRTTLGTTLYTRFLVKKMSHQIMFPLQAIVI